MDMWLKKGPLECFLDSHMHRAKRCFLSTRVAKLGQDAYGQWVAILRKHIWLKRKWCWHTEREECLVGSGRGEQKQERGRKERRRGKERERTDNTPGAQSGPPGAFAFSRAVYLLSGLCCLLSVTWSAKPTQAWDWDMLSLVSLGTASGTHLVLNEWRDGGWVSERLWKQKEKESHRGNLFSSI